MAESALHRRMKLIVRRELERENYAVLEEPLFPPSRRVSWSAYRPDLVGYREEREEEEFAVVECETHPSMKRFRSKNFSSLWFQPFLFQNGSIRRVLAVPQGRLRAVDLELREEWEIWVLGRTAPVCRIHLFGEGSQVCGQIGAVAKEERYRATVGGGSIPPEIRARKTDNSGIPHARTWGA